MAGWENWYDGITNGRGKLLKNALTEIKAAVDERCDAAGISALVALPTASYFDTDWTTFMAAIEAKIDALIPLFVDSENAPVGGFDGEATIGMWTEENILNETTAPTRLAVPTDPLISRPWLYQQKEILKLLIWVKKDVQFERKQASISDLYTLTPPDTFQDTWDDAVADWMADQWNALGWSTDPLLGFAGSQVVYWSPNVVYNHGITTTTCDNVRAVAATNSKATADFYGYAEVGPDQLIGGRKTYNSFGQYDQNLLNLLTSQTTPASSYVTKAYTDFLNAGGGLQDTPDDPDQNPVNDANYYQCQLTGYAVLKYNVTDGFNYV